MSGTDGAVFRELSAFLPMREGNAQLEEKAEATEAAFMKSLLASEAGRWLFGLILERGDIFSRAEPRFGSRDWYTLGRRNLALEFAEMIRRHGGEAMLAKIVMAREFTSTTEGDGQWRKKPKPATREIQ